MYDLCTPEGDIMKPSINVLPDRDLVMSILRCTGTFPPPHIQRTEPAPCPILTIQGTRCVEYLALHRFFLTRRRFFWLQSRGAKSRRGTEGRSSRVAPLLAPQFFLTRSRFFWLHSWLHSQSRRGTEGPGPGPGQRGGKQGNRARVLFPFPETARLCFRRKHVLDWALEGTVDHPLCTLSWELGEGRSSSSVEAHGRLRGREERDGDAGEGWRGEGWRRIWPSGEGWRRTWFPPETHGRLRG